MSWREDLPGAVTYSAVAVATYFLIQSVFVIVHEHIHSTTAYLMGHISSPVAIVWGNPLTLDGWDEGVSYSDLFSAGLGPDAAVIAVMPLIFHAIVVTAGLYVLLSPLLAKKKWWFHLIFWLVVMNLMELIAYMPMRAFAEHGDIGNINHGLGLSPWVLFFPGTLIILAWLYLLFYRVLPRASVVIAGDSQPIRYALLVLSAFFVFDRRSIFRMVLTPFPETEWVIGFVEVAACVIVILLCRPGMGHICRGAGGGGDRRIGGAGRDGYLSPESGESESEKCLRDDCSTETLHFSHMPGIVIPVNREP